MVRIRRIISEGICFFRLWQENKKLHQNQEQLFVFLSKPENFGNGIKAEIFFSETETIFSETETIFSETETIFFNLFSNFFSYIPYVKFCKLENKSKSVKLGSKFCFMGLFTIEKLRHTKAKLTQ